MKICVPIQERTQEAVMQRLDEIKGKADLAEVWLDHVRDLVIKTLIEESPLPLVCVCKKKEDMGMFKGSDLELSEIFTTALGCGAEYVDIPYGMPKNLSTKIVHSQRSKVKSQRSKVKCQMSKVIISFHDFKRTPPIKELLKKAREMKERGADIAKISVMANSHEDTLNIILLAQILQSENIPHILIAMGEKGILSRVITPFLGGTMMFAPLDKTQSSASGQMSVSELRKVWGMIG